MSGLSCPDDSLRSAIRSTSERETSNAVATWPNWSVRAPSPSTSPMTPRFAQLSTSSGKRLARWTSFVNNAGISGTQRPPAEADVQDLETVLATNVVGAARVLVACTPLLEGSATPVVVNVSSAVGSLTLNAKPDAVWSIVAYPMSKAALNMLTIQYARAFPRWRVNSVTPGLTLTEFTGRPTDSVDLDAFRRVGGRTVDEAVAILVEMATIGTDGPTGTFVGNDGPLPW